MKAKGVISDALEWKNARTFFYWRVRRRQLEDHTIDQMIEVSNGGIIFENAKARLSAILPSSDKEVVEWFDNNTAKLDSLLKEIKTEFVSSNIKKMMEGMSLSEIESILSKIK